ncbi:MAG: dockerin type I repeat-containing protein [Bacteroidales bacterium]|nr:dockerin type I repeat-containing protein [Candidatus Sodaliphilus aphodohippi]
MKKSLLFAIAALMAATSANAQMLQRASSTSSADRDKVAPHVSIIKDATLATVAESKAMAKKARPNAAAFAWYGRPAGQFYRGTTIDGGCYYVPQLYLRPYVESRIPNASKDATSYTWTYQKKNKSKDTYDTFTTTTTDLVVQWTDGELFAAPELKAGNSTYNLRCISGTGSDRVQYDGDFACTSDPFKFGGEVSYVSPHCYAAGTRSEDGKGYGTIIYQGAQGSPTDPSDGGGLWLGKNYSGWNSNGIYVEKPEFPYALRAVAAFYSLLEFQPGKSKADITATIYKASKDAEGNLIIGDVWETSKVELNTRSAKDGMMIFTFIEEEDGIESEVTLEVDESIFIAITGYDSPNLKSFTMEFCADGEDDGWGDQGYMFRGTVDNDVRTAEEVRPMSRMFKSVSLGCSTPSLYMDVEYPYVLLNYTADKAEYNFPVEGGEISKTFEDGKTHEGISIFSSKPAGELFVNEKGKNDIPDWLSIDIEDMQNDFDGHIIATVTAEPLPAGVNYREAVIDFGTPGGHLYYTMTQGDKTAPVAKPGDVNNDGSVDIKDLNIVLGQDDAANYDGRADVNGGGQVAIVDVNAIINLILG